MESRIVPCLCLTCGVKNDFSHPSGFCQNGHDDWLEYRDLFGKSTDPLLIERACTKFNLSLESLKIQFLDPKQENILINITPIFPNGFTSWHETHYEIVSAIHEELNKADSPVTKLMEEDGIGGLYEFAAGLTFEFETKFKGIAWGEELEYFDEIEKYLTEKLCNSQT